MKKIIKELCKEEALNIFGGEKYKWVVVNGQLIYMIVGTKKD